MRNLIKPRIAAIAIAFLLQANAQAVEKVVEISTRTGVTQRMLVISSAAPKASVILFAGGHGGLQIYPNGSFKWGDGNFLVRTRNLFAEQGFMVAVIDAPSDRQNPPYLGGFRQMAEHASDIKAVIAWMRGQSQTPVWLVGTSRGTQSVAYAATELSDADGPDGIVLTSTILTDDRSRAVPAMPLGKIRIPVLVVHHEQDGCKLCEFSKLPTLMEKLSNSPRKDLLAFKGGHNSGDPCEAMAYHGFNGLERDVIQKTAAWMLAK
ncbi:MAG: alpha/beta hydrolase [Rhodoferax sp.]|uniref:alpha/beta hydrolase n=1 Tax=Rhodoferax sp. TaxID=50421 RepID=UPI00271776E8|nr:alpha/beta hydrolase [Rhodoferax sp.]MDO8448794.1 alpha/beta hydrolase [Rhodoferax sp.]